MELAAGEATLMALAYHSIHNTVGENSGVRALALATSMWGRFAFYAFDNTPAGGNDDALGGSLNALRSLFKDYADPVPAIVEALEQQKIYL